MKSSKVILGILLSLTLLGVGARLGLQKTPDDVSQSEKYRDRYVAFVFPKLVREVQIRLNLGKNPGEIKHDLKEFAPKYEQLIADAGRKADENLANEPRDAAFAERFWAEKKRILKAEYGIDWKSPADMNPEVVFD
ncbi:hypothetical protein H6F78_16800 [Coleofasciculus sp. FACHB-64]|uniref:hypothetical protein n=1 Tax=Cyanophyceae TaxID=3028117 RepID=UPI0016849337|nr:MULTISPECIES: hypothetical protein [unclassified Coleofasciculus]MBD1839639.1 hypothetical protein [Coleofasciculus sp. FACHB-501]MBD2047233.1 hypothetical protein [Coleofasciculus sp. FACHB-64]